jgi:hypothetical protein
VKLIKPAAIIFIALAHAYIFGAVWAVVGVRAGFFVLGSTNLFFASVAASTFGTSLVVTSPLAFAAGRIAGKPLLLCITPSFVLAWAALRAWYVRPILLANKAILIPLVTELVVIACLSLVFSTLGTRARSARA